jgi:hypothetical protein
MSRYLAQLKALLAEKPFPEKLTELTEGASVSSVSDQRSSVFGEADSDSGHSGPVQRDEPRALVRWIADHFQSSPLGQCTHCGSDRRADDPFVTIFVGEDHAELHVGCYPAWVALQESEARAGPTR